ncbi:hypothetical protein SAICODRAFT_17108 [Saitoella complicata NRRL Y-17804]|uniref:uncharacterized protein n=1 Tax=Saitoella complicata (strain BCRC 22490 / CBS 7301 / JCM 7358 / NBRC 10748 / NRRL Y-17804) TaxID=698492 RepID=UPI000867A0FA|nr:uncharacterized protein SAICODRAFT_17108 [Saitoella complicata NRRL Y-17804]ODQ55353.1 hypothetical protein SAICODRAFT_17108 [Saitoella complicata NRRL Y-17804]
MAVSPRFTAGMALAIVGYSSEAFENGKLNARDIVNVYTANFALVGSRLDTLSDYYFNNYLTYIFSSADAEIYGGYGGKFLQKELSTAPDLEYFKQYLGKAAIVPAVVHEHVAGIAFKAWAVYVLLAFTLIVSIRFVSWTYYLYVSQFGEEYDHTVTVMAAVVEGDGRLKERFDRAELAPEGNIQNLRSARIWYGPGRSQDSGDTRVRRGFTLVGG